ncbi:glutamate-cysteine ligase family protein [Nonomuraea sp. NPDC050783]|uniref:glutamate-cysteine ligase family protein n=1 Tax=Nonomuraea sp. NPDC050783 TaxID=3154634 RepID=UPI0034662EF0
MGEARSELIGLELEMAAVDPATGRAAPYAGPRGVRRILEHVLEADSGTPVFDEDVLVAVRRRDGSVIALEPSSALEYSSAPCRGLTGLMAQAGSELRRLADVAGRLGIALVPGGNYPFNDISSVNWTPNRRIQIMSDYFSSVGDQGLWGPHVMGLTVSTQATFDFLSAADLGRKLQMLVTVSPVATALFVNSPLENGRPTGLRSSRMRYWSKHSPGRSGVLPPALRPEFSLDAFVEWAAALPMIYRKKGRGYAPAPARPFHEVLRHGFGDGTMPTWTDWEMHLSQIWTDVRLRRTLEARACDGPPAEHVGSLPAFWTGLVYDPASCRAAWELTRGHGVEDYKRTMLDIAHRGLGADFLGAPVREIAGELVRLAREGLSRRVADDLESPSVLRHLDPLEEILSTGETWADRCVRRWEGEFRHRPDQFVKAYQL